eukprot:6660589-Lingulodinium_polyedra.AAC.1
MGCSGKRARGVANVTLSSPGGGGRVSRGQPGRARGAVRPRANLQSPSGRYAGLVWNMRRVAEGRAMHYIG